MPILEVKNIRKSFGSTEVLSGIDFTLERGEILAIIGSSGSGKTTLLRCLNYLETPDEGTVTVDGERYFDPELNSSVTPEEKRRLQLKLGLVFQSFNLFPQYNVRENVTLAARLLRSEAQKEAFTEKTQHASSLLKEKLSAIAADSFADKSAKKDATREAKLEYKSAIALAKEEYKAAKAALPKELDALADSLLSKVGLLEKASFYPWQLSGGQQQRVAIARALALSPTVLCFDEPTSALDPELTDEVLSVIRGLKSTDSTMIVVTHEMNFAAHVADKIIFMANGKIEEAGTPAELLGNPKSDALRHFLAKTSFTL